MDNVLDSMSLLRNALVTRQVRAADITSTALHHASTTGRHLNAFLELFPDHALAQAADSDRRIAAGTARALEGIPIALKDNLCLSYGRTTCASRILENYRSPFTATAVQRLIDAGAIIIGKTNLDEFAMGSSGEHSAFGPTRNPLDPDRVPGGSSSGSAAAVAAGIVPAVLGSDTGGSIRQPAGFCCLVGVKPTYGRISRYGLVAFASSLDQIGPLTATVEDAALLLNVLCGRDPHDTTSLDLPPEDFTANLNTPIDNLILGVPLQARSPSNHPAVTAALDSAIATFRSLGAHVIDVDLPHTPHGVAAYYIIAPAEASSNLARFDGIRYGRRASLHPGEALEDLYSRSRAEGFGPEVQRRIMLGTHVLSAGYHDAYYTTALKVRRLIKQDFDRAFGRAAAANAAPAIGDSSSSDSHAGVSGTGPGRGGCHAILLPTSPSPAFKLGEKSNDPLALYLEDIYTVPANLAGLPAIAFPVATTTIDGKPLPIGLQLIGPPLSESTLLRIARQFEANRTLLPNA